MKKKKIIKQPKEQVKPIPTATIISSYEPESTFVCCLRAPDEPDEIKEKKDEDDSNIQFANELNKRFLKFLLSELK